MTVENHYRARFDTVLNTIADALKDIPGGQARIDWISTRSKSVDRFLATANAKIGDDPKHVDPLHQIQDQIGARIITFYKDDVGRLSEIVQKYFHPIASKDMLPEKAWDFGYSGSHHVLMLRQDVIDPSFDQSLVPDFFELQIRTFFHHAWRDANHDLGYNPGNQRLDNDELRQLAFTSAQTWGADKIFNDLFQKRESAGEY